MSVFCFHVLDHGTKKLVNVIGVCTIIIAVMFGISSVGRDRTDASHFSSVAEDNQLLPSTEESTDDAMCIGEELWSYHKVGNELTLIRNTPSRPCK